MSGRSSPIRPAADDKFFISPVRTEGGNQELAIPADCVRQSPRGTRHAMASLLKFVTPTAESFGSDRKRFTTDANRFRASAEARSVYIGNLAFSTTDAQIWSVMSRAGAVEKVVMGLNRNTREPCGFAFVIFADRAGAAAAAALLTGAVLDGRVIRVEMDKGFQEWRRWGRGHGGGQLRDEFRAGFDEGRGGYGAAAAVVGGSSRGPAQGGRHSRARSTGHVRRGRPDERRGDTPDHRRSTPPHPHRYGHGDDARRDYEHSDYRRHDEPAGYERREERRWRHPPPATEPRDYSRRRGWDHSREGGGEMDSLYAPYQGPT
jgi:hypothetical protein